MKAIDILVILVVVWFQELGHMVATGDFLGVVIGLMAGGLMAFVFVTLARLAVRGMSAATPTAVVHVGEPRYPRVRIQEAR